MSMTFEELSALIATKIPTNHNRSVSAKAVRDVLVGTGEVLQDAFVAKDDAEAAKIVAEDARDAAQTAETNAETAASLAAAMVSSTSALSFETRTIASAATISVLINFIHVAGYSAAGDGGAANYIRVGSAPAQGGFTSNSGTVHWDLSPRGNRVPAEAFGLSPSASAATNAAALQAAHDYSIRKQAKIIVGPGGFTIGGTGLRMETGFQLEGAGSGSANGTKFVFTANGYPLMGGLSASTTRHYNIRLARFCVDNEDKTRTGSVGIDFRNISTSIIDDVVCQNCNTGFQFYGDSLLLGSLYNHVLNTNATECNTGYEIGGVANRNTFIDIRTNITANAVVLGDCNNNNFYSPSLENTSGAYVVQLNAACYGNGLYGARIENSTPGGTGVKISSSSDYNFMVGEFFTGITTEVEDNSGKFLRFGPSATSFRGANITKMFRYTSANYALPVLTAGSDTGIVTFTVSGVASGDEVRLEHPYDWSGYAVQILSVVNAGTDTVQVIFRNYGGTTLSIPTYADLVFTVTRYE